MTALPCPHCEGTGIAWADYDPTTGQWDGAGCDNCDGTGDDPHLLEPEPVYPDTDPELTA